MAIYETVASPGPRRRLRVRSPVTLEPIGEFDCGSFLWGTPLGRWLS